jgi:branched-chain amino acid transport system permease protein
MSNLDILFAVPTMSMRLLIDGILIGALFALAAYGMALVWGVMNIINISQGEYVMLGGFVAVLMADRGMHPLFAVPVAAVLLFVLGWLLYRLVIFRIVDRDLFTSLLATFGLSIVLQQLMNLGFGGETRIANAGLGQFFLWGNQIVIAKVKVVAFVLVLVLGVCLMLFLKRSRLGQAIRATSQNARAARVLGIDTDRVYATTFALNAAICGAAGALVAMAYTIHPYFGLAYTIRSFMIVIVAGLGNLGAVMAAGVGLGSAEYFAGFLLGAEFQLAFVFGLLVVILLMRAWWYGRKRQFLK